MNAKRQPALVLRAFAATDVTTGHLHTSAILNTNIIMVVPGERLVVMMWVISIEPGPNIAREAAPVAPVLMGAGLLGLAGISNRTAVRVNIVLPVTQVANLNVLQAFAATAVNIVLLLMPVVLGQTTVVPGGVVPELTLVKGQQLKIARGTAQAAVAVFLMAVGQPIKIVLLANIVQEVLVITTVLPVATPIAAVPLVLTAIPRAREEGEPETAV